jgi:hypothetical protein
MTFESHVPGSIYYAGGAPSSPPEAARPNNRAAAIRTRSRQPWEPISQDSDPLNRDRRLRNVERDVVLHLSGEACPKCGNTARLSGGDGCTCGAGARALTARCEAAAAAVAAKGDPYRNDPACRPQPPQQRPA